MYGILFLFSTNKIFDFGLICFFLNFDETNVIYLFHFPCMIYNLVLNYWMLHLESKYFEIVNLTNIFFFYNIIWYNSSFNKEILKLGQN